MEIYYGEYLMDVLLFNQQLITYKYRELSDDVKGEYIAGDIKIINDAKKNELKELRTPYVVGEFYLSLNYSPKEDGRRAINLIGTLAPEKKKIKESKGVSLAMIPELTEKEKEYYSMLYKIVAEDNKLSMNNESYLRDVSKHGLVFQDFLVYSLKNANGYYLNTMINSLKTVKALTEKDDLKNYFMKNWDGEFKDGKEEQFYKELKAKIEKNSEEFIQQ